MNVAPVDKPGDRRAMASTPSPDGSDVGVADAVRLARQLKALADPTRLQIVEVLRRASPAAVCQCELTPLFQISQQALSKHLRTLSDAGVIERERSGVWTYYHLSEAALEEVRSWLA